MKNPEFKGLVYRRSIIRNKVCINLGEHSGVVGVAVARITLKMLCPYSKCLRVFSWTLADWSIAKL